jgi:hypothetical protein
MKHTRGRSPTERKSSTNAAKKQKNYNGLTAVEKEDDDSGHGHDAVDYPCDYWLQKMALFGDSSLALIGSFLLLGVAIVVSLHLDSDSNGSSFSSHLAAVIQLLPGWITASTTSWTNVDGSTINGRAQNDLTNGDSFQTRCSKPSDGLPAALQPGELNKMFHRITSSPIKGSNETEKLGYGHYSHDVNNKMEYSVLVHSHPGKIDYVVASSIKEGQSPWIITIDNFLSEEECESLIKIGHQQIFQRSIDVGKQNLADGRVYGKMTQRRTSESSWCTSESGCRDQDVPGRIHQRISNLLNIPSENSEDLQLLKYEVGQCKDEILLLMQQYFGVVIKSHLYSS